MGRPCSYTQEKLNEIVRRLSKGEPLVWICADEGMPDDDTVRAWMDREDIGEHVSRAIARARALGFDAIAADALRIADTPVLGETVRDSDKEGRTVTQEDMLGHRKLQVETRLKLLAKWDPKRYGDKLELAGNAEQPLQVVIQRKAPPAEQGEPA